MGEEGCSLPQSMGPLLSGPMEPRGERNRTPAQFCATVSGERRGSSYVCVWVVACFSVKVKQHCFA